MTEAANNNRMVLLLIAGLPVTMILLASWLWFYVERGDIDLVQVLGTANQGELLSPPLSLQDAALYDDTGTLVNLFAAANTQWRILIPERGDCDEACEQRLYYTRQIRTAMGKYTDRIERIYLSRTDQGVARFPQELRGQHPGLKILSARGASNPRLWETSGSQGEPAYFLVDPRGWVMMFYNADQDGKAVMADLKFLLKNSSG